MNDNLNETNILNTLDVADIIAIFGRFLDFSQQQIITDKWAGKSGKFIFSNFLPKIAKSFRLVSKCKTSL